MADLKTYSIKQASDVTGISQYALRKAIQDGLLKAIKSGNCEKSSFRITEKNLEAYINGGE